MDEINTLIQSKIPEGRKNLLECHAKLERIAEQCDDTYDRSDNKKAALAATTNYTTESLAIVANQINTLARNFVRLIDLQATQMEKITSQVTHISQTVMIQKEKDARREISVLTSENVNLRQCKIVALRNPEKPIDYVRKPMDYSQLDEIGHRIAPTDCGTGVGIGTGQKRHWMPNQGSTQSMPESARNMDTLRETFREYRPLSAVVQLQVPLHNAPNNSVGHLPPQIEHVRLRGRLSTQYKIPFEERSSMSPLPAALAMNHDVQDHGVFRMHTFNRNMPRPQSQSPPLPPPPTPEELDCADFENSRTTQSLAASIAPEHHNLPSWVPNNYIQKVVAIYDYYSDKDDELSFQENSVLYVLKKNDDGWWEGVMDGAIGLFPGNYVEPYV